MQLLINKQHNRYITAIMLLVLWLFGQSTLMAHDVLIDHVDNKACEWQCKTSKQDDFLPPVKRIQPDVHVYQEVSVFLAPVELPNTSILLPLLRGPPH